MRKFLSLGNGKQLFLLILLTLVVYNLALFLIEDVPKNKWYLYSEAHEIYVDGNEKLLNRADAITAQKMEEFKSELEVLFSKVKEKWIN